MFYLPRVRLSPGPTHAKQGQNVTLPQCHVSGFPAPVVTRGGTTTEEIIICF